jgi:hypothetical protein
MNTDALIVDAASPTVEMVCVKREWVELLARCAREAVEQAQHSHVDSDLVVKGRDGAGVSELLMNAVQGGGNWMRLGGFGRSHARAACSFTG